MVSRREVLAGASIAGGVATIAAVGAATQSLTAESAVVTAPIAAGAAFTNEHKPVPLPFAAGSLKGLSEKLLQSHWQNNYSGAVKALNLVRGRLSAALSDKAAPPYLYNHLKREQLIRTGSIVLHEMYFGNLGGSGVAGSNARTRLGKAFGSFDTWESEFRTIGKGLGGGSGWVVLGYNAHLNMLENYWLADHASHPADTTPLLVMDMYEHAYQMDYGADAAKYVDAVFANLNWEVVDQRIQKVHV